jgi:hypothetical protein
MKKFRTKETIAGGRKNVKQRTNDGRYRRANQYLIPSGYCEKYTRAERQSLSY